MYQMVACCHDANLFLIRMTYCNSPGMGGGVVVGISMDLQNMSRQLWNYANDPKLLGAGYMCLKMLNACAKNRQHFLKGFSIICQNSRDI